ncbi:MAG: FecR family protein [Candidatus Pseudobacter hemicellulosilyticus]|uniref:FecR family protein n=1 Tax=Candidatus Pseudobacter hemicellulosilyticus TaxID=3121375 RepID=A0AAJ5WPN0_9BACT|nr:MAG: FecR family protein [Pseudobacter sp.]
MKEEKAKTQAPQKNNSFVPMAAALIIFGIAAFYVLYYYRKPDAPIKPTDHMAHELRNDLPPGKARATLTLEGQQPLVLDSLADGQIAYAGLNTLSKTGNRLQWKGNTAGAPAMVTLSTPVGGLYTVTLSDGTTVWLNAASSLQFPETFPAGSREVALKGQAYFEIAPGGSQPFVIHTEGMTLGSSSASIDLKNYSGEPGAQITMVNGNASVSLTGTGTVQQENHPVTSLNTGDQAFVAQRNSIRVAAVKEPAYAADWINHQFHFNNDSITTVMRDLERWFGARVVYEGDIPAATISGKVASDIPLSLVLNFLRGTGKAHFRQDNGTVYVTKK